MPLNTEPHQQFRSTPDRMAHMIANHLADRSRGLMRTEIIDSLGLDDVEDKTVYRWLVRAKELGLVTMTGNTKSAAWMASDELRREVARKKIASPLTKRPIVTYDELWLRDYIPNETFYLSDKDRKNLASRCPPGSAPISAMDKHDLSLFLCGLPYASSRMEGNPYDFLATIDLIEKSLELKSASKSETQMVLNHHQAVRFLVENINHPPQEDDVGVTARDIRTIHALLSDNLLTRPEMAGKIRSGVVTISNSSYKPLDVRESLESCLDQIVQKASEIKDPFEQSFFLTAHLPYLQPFVDCNKRTARVVCNIPLLRNGVAPMSWMDVEPTAFTDGLIAIYELNEVGLLSEVFVDGYMRSIERFNIMKNEREPDEVRLKYASEIRQAVKFQVLEQEDFVPASVAPQDVAAFLGHVEAELARVADLDQAAMARNKVKAGDVIAWRMTIDKKNTPTEAA